MVPNIVKEPRSIPISSSCRDAILPTLNVGTYVRTKHMVARLLKDVVGCKTMENKFSS